ncbi:hypothetical protein EJ04DRAFT_552623 [Polyplosphaeria fusca]|uniref:Uncharacterized protein n=1 Tax=Polyplosphaeria fusca TaxID=682080 RepID=A0A9P4QVH1_9PLEO|nr:hypothetical protein EJ04DRAFT_552623 [Polyplosphaeria fusca]
MALPIEHTNDPDAKFTYVPPTSEGLEVVTEEHLRISNSPISPQTPRSPRRYHGASQQHGAYADLLTTPDTIRRRIEASASKNSALLVVLGNTANAPGALTVKKIQIEKIKEEMRHQDRIVRSVEIKVDTLTEERKGGGKTLKDILRRAKLLLTYLKRSKDAQGQSGQEIMKDENLDESEKTYFEALAEKSREQKRQKELLSQLALAESEAAAIEPQAEQHGKAHQDIDALYDSIFAGPTPGFPDEDAKEAAFRAASQQHEDAKNRALAKRRGIRTIEQAQRNWRRANVYGKDAIIRVENSVFLALSDYKYDLLNMDHYRTVTGVSLDNAALQLAPMGDRVFKHIRDLQAIIADTAVSAAGLDKGNLLAALAKAKQLLEFGTEALEWLMEAARDEERDVRIRVRDTAQLLDDTRSALQEARQQAFEGVAGYGAAPPAYNNCCERTDQYDGECDVLLATGLEDEEPDPPPLVFEKEA